MNGFQTGWPTAAPKTEPTLQEKQNAVLGWRAAKSELDAIKETEMSRRKAVTEMLFPTPKKGTQRYDFGQGYQVKLVYKLNYKLGDANLIDEGTGAKISVQDQINDLQDEIDKLGPQAELLNKRLIKWTPDLSVSEYEKLDMGDDVQRQIKLLIEKVLTISEASPTLEFEEPKA